MLRQHLMAAIVLLAAAIPARAQSVDYEKYELPNGMTVILHEDHSVPSACINLWYYVASKDEKQGRSGFAHLFEHLMFMGTQRVPGSDFDNLMEAEGGFNNASTSKDRTNYFSFGPSELLPTLLWLDADRLEALGENMTQEKLDKQRAVVRNERRQTSENRPYGRSELKVTVLMYPKDHPYHNTVIGSHEDLEAATVDDVKEFFATYYVPSNASLVVAGAFDPDTIKPLVNDLFGTLPRGSDVIRPDARPARLDRVKRMTMTDNVQFARTTMVYHSPPHYKPGDAEMDLVAGILADGISSRLYQKLVYENEWAVDVEAYQSSMLHGSLFYLQATAKPGVELATIENAIDEVVAEFQKKGPTKDELNRQKTQLEFSALRRLQSVLGKADALNRYQFHFGEPNSFKQDLDRYRNATRKDVKEWARKVVTQDARLIMRVIPELKSPENSPRDAQPQVAQAPQFSPRMPETFRLSNGITVHHWQRSELPLMEVSMLFPYGSTSDPASLAGLADLTADMLDEGAGERGALAFSDELDLLGARVSSWTSKESAGVDLSALARNLEPALELYADAILRPRFEDKEWQRVQRLHVQRLVQLQDRPGYVAQTAALESFFGSGHPYGRPGGGTVESAESISLNDVKRFHAQLYRPTGTVVLAAGDKTAAEIESLLESAFGNWKDATNVETLPQPVYGSPANESMRVVVVDRPDAVQTVIQFVMPGPVYADPKRVRLKLFNTILGGGFTSRLNQNLREEHGYTYGAGSWFSMNPSVGYFSASSSVKAGDTGAAVGEFLKEFAAIKKGDISAEEAKKARASGRMDMIQTFAGLRGIIGAATTLVRNNRPFSDLGEQLRAISEVDQRQLNELADAAVPLNQGVLVLVGDRDLVAEQLQGLELPAPVFMPAPGTR